MHLRIAMLVDVYSSVGILQCGRAEVLVCVVFGRAGILFAVNSL